ncbi:hypothetical protein ACFPLA_09680 [Brevibacterium otitidis]|nr:hypothetical protein GCM10023233_26060 [Brevibacterium otitidis]
MEIQRTMSHRVLLAITIATFIFSAVLTAGALIAEDSWRSYAYVAVLTYPLLAILLLITVLAEVSYRRLRTQGRSGR